MRPTAPFWSLAILAPLILAPLILVPLAATGLLGGMWHVLPSLTTIGQILVACLSVFALWVGLAPERR